MYGSQCINYGAGTSVRQMCKNTGLQSRCARRGAPVLAQLPTLPACCLSEDMYFSLPLSRLTPVWNMYLSPFTETLNPGSRPGSDSGH